MDLIPKAERSDLSVFFRRQAARALRNHILANHDDESSSLLKGVYWGTYIAYKNSSDMVDLNIVTCTRKAPKSPRDTPAYLKQSIDPASVDHEAAGHPQLAAARINHHD